MLDDNDHPPVFDPAVYPIAISESTSAGSTIVRVFASDNDIGSNAMLSYDITRGNNSGKLSSESFNYCAQFCNIIISEQVIFFSPSLFSEYARSYLHV